MFPQLSKEPTQWVRWGLSRDLPTWVEIDAECAAAQGRAPVTEAWLRSCLRERNCISMTVERGDTLLAFMVYELHGECLDLVHFAFRHANPRAASDLLAKYEHKIGSHQREYGMIAGAAMYQRPDVRPEWITSDVRALCAAGHPYLPVLADALQDAGCDCEFILAGLRTPRVGEVVWAMLAEDLIPRIP